MWLGLPGSELWVVVERGLDQAAKVKCYLSNAALKVLETSRLGEKAGDGITLPDVRRLLQALLAREPPRDALQWDVDVSAWRQMRN